MRPIDCFDTAAEVFATRLALMDDQGNSMTFASAKKWSDRIARGLERLPPSGIKRVAIVSQNDYRVLLCTLGIMRAGGVVAPVHATDVAEDSVKYLERIKPTAVFFHSSQLHLAQASKNALSKDISWICIDSGVTGFQSLDEFGDDDEPYVDNWGDRYGNPERPAYIRRTSGTTGVPKIVVGNIASFDATQMVHLHKLACDCRPVCMVAAPLSHAAGVHAFSMLSLGATLLVVREFNPVDILERIEKYRITHLWLPPSALYLLLNCPEIDRFDYSSLRSLVLGASAVAPSQLIQAVKMFGPCVNLNYSQIESGFVTWLDAPTIAAAVNGDHPERLRSSGTNVFVSRIGIMTEDGRLCHHGEIGEVVLRGPAVKPFISGPYTEDTTEMAAAGGFGWHHTGDLGYCDADGFLYVVGRKKDNIIVGGFKVSAAEVEAVILEMPEVSECAVVAVFDEARGEAIKAVVVCACGIRLDSRQALGHCRLHLPPVKCPSSFEQWEQLPRNAVGKIDKRQIKDELARRKDNSGM
jgi:acyl-CoA synthetase (AMP-forming)/AMP-acid ligase II